VGRFDPVGLELQLQGFVPEEVEGVTAHGYLAELLAGQFLEDWREFPFEEGFLQVFGE